jgi:two-component system OmpR family response regulator
VVASADALERDSRLRVLCVDDNRDVADSSVILLQTVGFEAKSCYDGASALAEARIYLPNVLFIDLNMPGMDGDELVARLQGLSLLEPTLFVALTAQNSEEAKMRIEAAGFHHHMVKPVDPCKLIGVVDAFYRLQQPEKVLKEIS